MNYKELVDLLNVSEIGGRQINFLKKYIKENRVETDQVDEEILNFTKDVIKGFNSRTTFFVNNQIAEGIQFLVRNSDWSNLTQILTSLPKEIQKSIPEEDGDFLTRMRDFANQVDIFLNLSSEQRKKALAAI